MSRDELIRDLARELRKPRYDLRNYCKTANQLREEFVENADTLPWNLRPHGRATLRELIDASVELYKDIVVDALLCVDELTRRAQEIDEAE